MSEASYIIGVDAGGTYTDAVIVNARNGETVHSAKRPTTHWNLRIGIEQAVAAVMTESSVEPAAITTVSVSTTLATNALVEDKGARVGLLVIGFNQRMDVPVVAARYIPGGHTIKGDEEEPLGINYIIDALQELHGEVDAWAVCSSMAFKNPTHELVAAKAISVAGKTPVFCSHEASMRAGMKERAATSVLNAQLLPVMQDFLQGVRDALTELSINAKVLVVRGDARAMDMKEAVRQAASTVASGPAATALYGACKSGRQDALIVDVGGTTTDITLVRGGNPVIDENGMVIGNWETHVRAVEMFTVGIGGDSHIAMKKDGSYSVGPQRVVPLCMAENLPDPAQWLGPDRRSRCILPTPSVHNAIRAEEPVLQHLHEHGPATPEQLMKSLNLAEITIDQHLERLSRRQLVVEAGFTPTDALHTLGHLDIGNAQNASVAAKVLADLRAEQPDQFAQHVLDTVEQQIQETILKHVTRREVGGQLSGFLAGRHNHSLINISINLTVPMVGIGAAARYLLPGVAKRFGTDISFPEQHEVGNALGAALMAIRQQ